MSGSSETVNVQSGDPRPSATAAGHAAVPGYEILEELGRGGMGVVYKALQVRLDRVVALKMILAGGHAGEADLHRFRTEAEAIGRLQHPNIVQVFEVGEHQGLPFFSLEYCPGGSLEKQLQGTPLPPHAAVVLIEKLARAMQAAHEAQVVHRDLKPANVLLGADGSPKVTDFGLAKKLDHHGQTQTGAVMGTPSYMAPEQAEARKTIGPAADVYALGAILYEGLTGRPPFRAATTLETLRQVIAVEPVPPAQLAPGIPRDLETIALKCLQKEPGKRYSSAGALADDLQRFLDGAVITARPVGRLERAWRWCHRNQVVVGALGAVALVLIAATAVSLSFGLAATQQARLARASEQAALREKERADDERRKALENEHRAHALLYVARMNQAHGAWQFNQPGHVRELLALYRAAEAGEPFLGFEWHFLDRLTRLERLRVEGPLGFRALDLSPDGTHIVVCGRATWLIDARTGRTIWAAPEGGERVLFSPDGKVIACYAGPTVAQEAVTVLDAGTGKRLARFPKASQPAFGPDGTLLAALFRPSGFPADEVRIVDWRTGKTVRSIRSSFLGFDPLHLQRLAWSPDGTTLAAGGARLADPSWVNDPRNVLYLLQVGTGKLHKVLTCVVPGPSDLRYSRDSRLLAAPYPDGSIQVWDAATGQERVRLKCEVRCTSVAFRPDGRQLAATASDGTVRIWDLPAGRQRLVLRGGCCSRALAYFPDGRRLVSLGEQGLRVQDATREQDGHTIGLVQGYGRVQHLAFLPGGSRLATAVNVAALRNVAPARRVGRACVAAVWDAEVGTQVVRLDGYPAALVSSGDGRRLATLHTSLFTSSTEVRICDAAGRRQATFRVPGEVDPDRLALAPAGDRLALHEKDRGLTVWDVAGGKRTSLPPIPNPISAPTFSSDGRLLAVACRAGKTALVQVWDEVSASRLLLFPTEQEVRTVQFVAGERLAILTPAGCQVRDVRSGVVVRSFRPGFAERGCFSGDGRRLLTTIVSEARHNVYLWDVDSGQLLLTLPHDLTRVSSLAYDREGKRLAAGGERDRVGAVRVWSCLPPADRQEARLALPEQKR